MLVWASARARAPGPQEPQLAEKKNTTLGLSPGTATWSPDSVVAVNAVAAGLLDPEVEDAAPAAGAGWEWNAV
ncbi:hypothetical protein GCM10027596_24690 [Nocardioides korecus]